MGDDKGVNGDEQLVMRLGLNSWSRLDFTYRTVGYEKRPGGAVVSSP